MFKKEKGYSLQSVIIGVVITGIISTVGVANLWPTAENSKVGVLASYLQEQQGYITTELKRGFGSLEDLNNPALGGDDKIQDYLSDLISAGRVSNIPEELFIDPAALTWEVRSLSKGGNVRAYYIHISSTNKADNEMILKAIDIMGVPGVSYQ